MRTAIGAIPQSLCALNCGVECATHLPLALLSSSERQRMP
jgi:hypothetical protein